MEEALFQFKKKKHKETWQLNIICYLGLDTVPERTIAIKGFVRTIAVI